MKPLSSYCRQSSAVRLPESTRGSSIADFVRAVSDTAPTCRGEEEFRHAFIRLLEDLLQSRGVAPAVRLEENVVHGRADARIGLLVFEFKEHRGLQRPGVREEALNKVKTAYLRGYVDAGFPAEKLTAIITDGDSCAALSYDVSVGGWTRVDPLGNPQSETSPFLPWIEYAVWLETVLNGLAYRELTPENLLDSFGPRTALGRRVIKNLWDAFEDPAQKRRKARFFEQWKVLFSIATQDIVPPDEIAREVAAYGLDRASVRTDEQVRQFLFVVHTYYALILKLLAIRIVDELGIGGPVSLIERIKQDPDGGLRFAEETVPRVAVNVVERDVFSWMEGTWTHELREVTKEMARRFEVFDVEGVQRDVLKRVYQNVISTKLRKALGEFYTKDWTADLLLDEAGYTGRGRLLDPSCGSGTFLALAIKRSKRVRAAETPSVALAGILSSVVGFDVNPVAVATARINYLLSILDLVLAARPSEGVSLPVYLCDSVVLPKNDPLAPESGVYWVDIAAWQNPVGVPVPSPDITQPRTSDPARVVLNTLRDSSERSTEQFLDALRAKLGPAVIERFSHEFRELHRTVQRLEERGVNGIWASFILNFFAPIFERRFDFVVGNPPWVAPQNTPRQYLDKVAEIVRGSGYQEEFRPGFGVAVRPFAKFGQQYVACLPFVHLAATRYLSQNGTIAFLLTSSLIKSLNAGGWRRRVMAYGLKKVVDLTLITDIHEGASSWAFIPVMKADDGVVHDRVKYRFATRQAGLSRRSGRASRRDPERTPALQWQEWELEAEQMRLITVDEKSPWLTGSPEFLQVIRKMQKHAVLGDRYRVYRGIDTSGANKTYFLRKVRRTSARLIAFTSDGGDDGLAEEDVVFPLIRGGAVRAWQYKTSYMLLPHASPEFRAIPEGRLRSSCPEAWEYFFARRQKLAKRGRITPSLPFYNVLYLSRRKVDTWKVALPEVSPMIEASAIPPRTRDEILGEKHAIPDHKVYYVAVGSEDEAHYTTAVLNSAVATAFAYQLATPKGGVPWRDYHQWNIAILPFPPYDSGNGTCGDLVEFSRQSHSRPSHWDAERQAELDSLASQRYGLTKGDALVLTENLRLVSGGLLPARAGRLGEPSYDSENLPGE